MTKQEYLDLISTKIDERAFPAYSEESSQCLYLAEDGKECFVGVIIPNNAIYKKSFLNILCLSNSFPQVKDLFPEGCDVNNMLDLQEIHDNYSNLSPEEFYNKKDEIIKKVKKVLGI